MTMAMARGGRHPTFRATAHAFALASTLLGAGDRALAQSGVFVSAGEEGQGLLRSRGRACYVIVPRHVVEESVGPMALVGFNRVRGEAEIEQIYAADLAVLRVLPGGDLTCSPWSAASTDAAGLEAKARSAATLALRLIDETGAERRVPVDLRGVDPDTFTVRPRSASDSIAKSASGASLVAGGTAGGQVLGILLSVCGHVPETGDEGGCTAGDADVLRLDAVERFAGSFFRETSRGNAAASADLAARVAAQVAARDAARMRARQGREPDVPAFGRDLDSLALLPLPGSVTCGARNAGLAASVCRPASDRATTAHREPARHLYAALTLSAPILSTAPPLPESPGECALLGAGRPLRRFPLPAAADSGAGTGKSVHVALAWGDDEAVLPAGEYWLRCEIGGVPFESRRLVLEEPVLPWGRFALEGGGEFAIRTIDITGPDGDASRLALDPRRARPVVAMPLPARPDGTLEIAFEARARGGGSKNGADIAPPPTVHCEAEIPAGGLSATARGEPLAGGDGWRWRVSFALRQGRWRAGSFPVLCALGGPWGLRVFEFLLDLG